MKKADLKAEEKNKNVAQQHLQNSFDSLSRWTLDTNVNPMALIYPFINLDVSQSSRQV